MGELGWGVFNPGELRVFVVLLIVCCLFVWEVKFNGDLDNVEDIK